MEKKNSEHEENIELADMEREKEEAEKKKTVKKEVKTYRVSQKGMIYNYAEKKFLLLKVKNKEGFFYKTNGPWELAGGHVEDNENLADAVAREIKEELEGLEFEVVDLVDSILIDNPIGKTLLLGYLVKYLGGEINLSEEHCEYKWENEENIKKSDEYKPWLKNFIKKASEYLEKEEYLNGWKRAQADFENYKKQQAQAQKDFARFAARDLVMRIIPVLDNFHASTDHIPESQKENPWVVGIMHIQKQLENVLKENGVEEIEAKIGDEFDPESHEAVTDSNLRIESESTNIIKKIVSKGYKMENKVIRPAKVIVE